MFGESVTGYHIPVLNEREIRAGAGILFLLLMISFFLAAMLTKFLMIKYFVVVFLIDISIRLFVSPRYSPFLILGRLIVRNQTPEYVGAAQKKFAWYIGLGLASLMFVLMVVMNTFSIFSGLSCLICMIFLFFESAFGICLGCLLYRWTKKDKAQYCPGEICDVKARQDIQKTSGTQLLMLVGLTAVVVLVVFLFNDSMSQTPVDLFEMLSANG